MKKTAAAALLIAGIINLVPVIGVISVDQLVGLYGIPLENSDLIILMRHRAILFGLLGAVIIYSAFRESLQTLASIAGLISMLSFIALAYGAGKFGEAFNRVIVADVVGSIALVFVLFVRAKSK